MGVSVSNICLTRRSGCRRGPAARRHSGDPELGIAGGVVAAALHGFGGRLQILSNGAF
jgi:hypothetical protein